MKAALRALTCAAALLAAAVWPVSAQTERVAITVNTAERIGPMTPIWAWFGHDEPNYTYMKDGQKLLTELQAAEPGAGVRARAQPAHDRRWHSPRTSGARPTPTRRTPTASPSTTGPSSTASSTRYLQRGMKPLVQIGFMPRGALHRHGPYRHHWKPGDDYNDIYTGWAHPPKDYDKWSELVYQWVKHSVEKYGQQEVESWWWEVWNEPDIGYWQGTYDEYVKLYDYAADGLKRALPTARIGGPEVTGPIGDAHAAVAARLPRALPARHQLRHRQEGRAARFRDLPRQGRAAGHAGRARAHEREQRSCARSTTGSRSSPRSPS